MKQIKRWISGLLVLCMMLSMVPVTAHAETASGTCGENLNWTLSDDGVLTISGTGPMEDYSGGGAPWYSERVSITAVVIEDGVTTIGDYTFYECSSLISVDISDSVTSIGDYTFGYCSNLEKLIIPKTVSTIGSKAYYACTSLLTAGPIGSGCNIEFGWETEIPANAFHYAYELTDVLLPSSITIIGPNAFFHCWELKNIVLPDGLTKIGYSAFAECATLEHIEIPASVTTTGDSIFEGCKLLTSAGPIGSGSNIEFGWNDAIPDYAFCRANYLTSINLPEELTGIGWHAFTDSGYYSDTSNWTGTVLYIETWLIYGTDNPTDSTMGNGYTTGECIIKDGTIGVADSAFRGCYGMTSVIFPDSVKYIGNDAFYNCSGLNEMTLPADLVAIGDYSFYCCAGLTSIEIPDGTSSIGTCAFCGCSNLTQIIIPASVTYIGRDAFSQCDNLTDVYFGGSQEDWEMLTDEEYEEDNSSFTMHFSTTDPDAGENDSSDDGEDPDDGADTGTDDNKTDTTSSAGSVVLFSEWDDENQIAYFGMYDLTGSRVTDETDISFLTNIDSLIGQYVLAETKAREDGLSGPDTLISIKPVETKIGIVSTANDEVIVIDNVEYAVPADWMFVQVYEGKKVRYHLYDKQLVGIVVLEDMMSEPEPDRPHLPYEEPDEKTEDENPLAHHAEEWLDAYNQFVTAMKKVLEDYAGKEIAEREAIIAAEADRMRRADSNSNSKYINFEESFPQKYKIEAYTALAELLYDYSVSNFEFSSTDLSSNSAGTSLVKSIMRSMQNKTEQYSYGNVVVEIHIFQAGGAKFGSLTCFAKTKPNRCYTAVICSTQEECQETIEAYLDELNDFAASATYNIYSAVYQDILGKSLNSLTEDYLTKKVTVYGKRFAGKFSEKMQAAGIGNLVENLNTCHNYYKLIKKVINGNLDSLEGLLDEYGKLKFEDDSITKKAVKKAMSLLQKAANNLNEASAEYLAGTLEESDISKFFRTLFNCPVSVEVYNSAGNQIGYVGEDDIWYTDEIIISENGGSKCITSLTDDLLTFKVIGTDYGTLSCSIEAYVENCPSGRLNFYNIELTPSQEYSLSLSADISGDAENLAIISDGELIYADEYISSTQNAVVNITCDAVADDGTSGGTIKGTSTYVRGDAVLLVALPDENYEFLGWYIDNVLVCLEEVYEFTAREDLNVVAKFCYANYCYVDLVAEEGGSVVGSTRYVNGETAVVCAFPYDYNTFEGWYDGDELISVDEEYEFVVTENVVLTARFGIHEHTYYNPAFDWSDDNTCTATFICIDCDDTQTVDCIVTSDTTPATENEAGVIVYTATVENDKKTYTDTKTVEIPATGHVKHTTTLVPATEASCNHSGNIAYYTCSGCDLWFEDAAATIVIEEHDSVILPMTDHNYESVVTAPTCTEQGYTTHTCLVCGDIYMDAYVDALGHCFEDGFCAVCGEPDPDYEEPTKPSETVPSTPVKPGIPNWYGWMRKFWEKILEPIKPFLPGFGNWFK